ncbi:adenylate/guanylate cyclase domain-containing protein [Mesorhizobium sp. 10J20-29]
MCKLTSLLSAPDNFSPDFARFFVLGQIAYPLGLIVHIGYFFLFWFLELELLAAFNILSIFIFLFAAWQHNNGKMFLPLYAGIVFEAPTHAVLATVYLGLISGYWLTIFVVITIIALAPFVDRKIRIIIVIMMTTVMSTLGIYGIYYEPISLLSNLINTLFLVSNIVVVATIIIAAISSYDVAVYRAEAAVKIEFDRAESLLLNILPLQIATRLKAQEEPLADNHESVSVLFADLAGFTDISRKMSADELVNLLNDLFSRFDKLATVYGAEKIKTIGDAYMVATGLQGSVGNHAERIADLALGMQKAFVEFRKDNNVDLKLRIGVHSGPVIAGVIGKQKFSYDLWGNTVNIASRMESEGVADQIQISAETWKLLSKRYQTSPRGEIKIKGHRPRPTYLLEGNGLATEAI